ncbi:phage tail sheath C-terminal domain-containing protein [Halpernia frigidisoli]|uniref:phage tail sheath C-terminal domain-containing protein n=1 Tax=Halpernia frigidisoli TaxID=1125876 RepID=UPI000A7E3F8E|nr:phage tail sheath C-terminal domain-containing protein [Halpernia frigidisoli]
MSLNSVLSPAVSINNDKQTDLNNPSDGKYICAIRTFPVFGTLIWGGRTLDGNSVDWRYINVRRTMIMVEQSVQLAVKAYVFEPNDANTWVTVKSMLNNFLFNLWKQGAFAGSAPEEAFSVSVGLGSTMTPDDILEGKMNVSILVAISKPSEFIIFTFQLQMQQS